MLVQLAATHPAEESLPASEPTHAPPWHVMPPVHAAWFCHVPVLSQSWGVAPEHRVELGTQVPEQTPAPLQA